MKKENMKAEKGITLIALVITIIVLLILATVTIQAILGDDGVLNNANNAKNQTEIGTEKEQISLSYSSCKLDKTDNFGEEITAEELENKMNASYGTGTVEVTGKGLLRVLYTESNRGYLVLAQGNTIVEEDVIIENLTYENSVGVSENGKLVDMSLWEYGFSYEYATGKEWYNIAADIHSGGYMNIPYVGNIVDGRIEGEMPAYILDLRYSDEFLPVINFVAVFHGFTELEYPPVIPSTAEDISAMFRYCENLIEAPVIPEGVKYIGETFAYCYKLEKAPKIPDGVINMSGTFRSCEKIVEAPKLPSSLTRMTSTFSGCSSLVEAPAIPGGVTTLEHAFVGCRSLIKPPVIPDKVTSMDGTFKYCINLVEPPIIPESVTDMSRTFDGCTKLEKAPIIPKNVKSIDYIFVDCVSLTGELIINANFDSIVDYRDAFRNTATNEGCDLVLSGSSTMLNTLLSTKSANSNIRIGN